MIQLSSKRIYLCIPIILLILLFSHPINAFEVDDVIYTQIGSVTYEKGEYRDNTTDFNFIIMGQIINTLNESVTITTLTTYLYSLRIYNNLDQGTQGGFSPFSELNTETDHLVQPGINNYSLNVTLGIFGYYDILPDGNYTFIFEIGRINGTSINSIPHLIVYQNGIISHSENIITFNTQMPVTSTTNTVTSNSEQIVASSEATLIDPLRISSSYLLFLLLPIFSIIKSRFT